MKFDDYKFSDWVGFLKTLNNIMWKYSRYVICFSYIDITMYNITIDAKKWMLTRRHIEGHIYYLTNFYKKENTLK